MSKNNFNNKSKEATRHFLRLPKELLEKIDLECERLQISRNSWIVMTLDREISGKNLQNQKDFLSTLDLDQ